MIDGLIGVFVSIVAIWVMQFVDISPNKIPFEKGPHRMERYVNKYEDQVANRAYSDWAESLMIYAIKEDHRAVLDSLISFGYPVNHKIKYDSTLITPLSAAILSQNEYITRQLTSRGADPNIMSQNKFHPLVSAIVADFDTTTINLLLEAGANPNYFDQNNSTPLNTALSRNQFEIVDLLLAHGADINLLDFDDWSPLHYTTIYGEGILQSFILERGAEVDVLNSKGVSPLFTSAANGNEYMMLELLERGATVDLRSNSGTTALVAAIQEGSLSCAYLLIEAGADLNIEYDNGRTPASALLAAVPYLHTNLYNEFLQILFDSGKIDRERLIYRGLTPVQIYYYAFVDYLNEGLKGDVEPELMKDYISNVVTMTNYFIDQGFDLKKQTENGWTILHKLSTTSAPSVLSIVPKEYKEVNLKNSHGSTPLILAIQTGNIESVRMLLEAGGDPNVADSDGIPGMDWAILNGDSELIEIVEEAGGIVAK